MKILIPIERVTSRIQICRDFDSAPEYLLYQMETGRFTSFNCRELVNKYDGAGFIDILLAEEIQSIVTYTIRSAAYSVLKKRGVKIYKSDDEPFEDVIKKLNEDQLHLMKEEELIPFKGCLAGDCSSCGTTCSSS